MRRNTVNLQTTSFSGSTMGPRLTATSSLRLVFFGPAKRPYISLLKKPLMRSAFNTANGHIIKSQTEKSLIISPR